MLVAQNDSELVYVVIIIFVSGFVSCVWCVCGELVTMELLLYTVVTEIYLNMHECMPQCEAPRAHFRNDKMLLLI